jgi:peptidoglycan/xylan/chitin deacetylase (PgdA/CDA1 family)
MMFPKNKSAAISFTFDDGSREHFDVVVPLLNEFGFKGTFFVIAGLTREQKCDPLVPNRQRDWWAEVSWQEWRTAANQGHEIGNHSLTHPVLTQVREQQRLGAEVVDSARLIEEKIGQWPASFAYPYNKSSTDVRQFVLQHHHAVREERIRYGGPGFTLAKANRHIDRAIDKEIWIVPMIHGIGHGFDPLDPDVFRQHLQYIKDREAEVLVDTFGTVSAWVKRTSA